MYRVNRLATKDICHKEGKTTKSSLATTPMTKKEKEATAAKSVPHYELIIKEKFKHSLEALKERIRERTSDVKHSFLFSEDVPSTFVFYDPPPPYPENENPTIEDNDAPSYSVDENLVVDISQTENTFDKAENSEFLPRYSEIEHLKPEKKVKKPKSEPIRYNPEEIRNILKNLQKDENLEDWLEIHGMRNGVDVAALKNQLGILLKDTKEAEARVKPVVKDLNPEWQKQLEKLKDLNKADNLEKWLDGLDVPHNVLAPQMKAKLKKYFMHETFETFQGRSAVYREDTRAKKLWDEFREMNPVKQVAVVAGITIVTAIVGFFTWELYLLAFPNALAVNPFFVEVGAQIFIQRQEGAFHLLVDQTERTKPLSTAWANQYILWKYL